MWPAVILSVVISALVVCMVVMRRSAEEKFRRSESRYRQLVDALPHYIYSVDLSDRYVAVNAAAADYFRRPEAEVIGKTAVELGTPPEVARDWTTQNARIRSGAKTQTVDIVSTVRGETRYIRNTMSPTRDERGQITGVTGIGIDMTEQKLAEAAMGRLLSAVEQLDEVMFMTDVAGRITYVNPAFERVYRYSRDEAIGQTPRIIKSGELSQADYQRFWSELLAGHSVRIEYRNRAKDGSLVDVIGTATPLMDEGKIAGFVAVQQDVTERNRALEERRRLDERLQRLAKMEALGTLAGGIAHDFNNILSVILTHVDLIERTTPREPRAARAIQTVRQAVLRGAGLSRQILTFARRAEVSLRDVDVALLIRELGSMLAETLPRTITVTASVDASLPHVMADAGQLQQALLNLCLNARDAMPDGGALRISAQVVTAQRMKALLVDPQPSDCLCIVVSDDGTGMDAETRQRIFEPFFTTKELGKGTGLGLAVVYGIVNAHHGLVDLESQPGQGTTFRIYLPIATTTATDTFEPPSLLDLSGGTETLLVIDDEAAILDALEIELSSRGYHVITASDGPQALEMCEGGRDLPDAIVTDLGMPKMSAPDLVRALREILPTVPLIGMTGYVDPTFHESILAAGVERIVQKPFEVGDLLRNLREMLDQRHPPM
jgi:PAS domain S-box-containing protein